MKKSLPASVDGVGAVDRALAVLTAFRRGDATLSLAELAERTGLVKSTIMRLAVSLERSGLVRRTQDGSGYELDAEVLRLGAAYQAAFDLADHVVPVLERLASATGETASFYVRRGDQRLCLFRAESANELRMNVQPGDTRPMDKSAIAQVLKGDGGLNRITFTSGVTDPHTAALATPVHGADGTLVGALAISGPVSRLTEGRARSFETLLADAGQSVTRACGGIAAAAPRTRRQASK